jgi:hypothetical protein
MRTMIANKTNNAASQFGKSAGKMNKQLDKIIDKMEDLE